MAARIETFRFEIGGPVAKMKIPRRDLARFLLQPACKQARFRYGERFMYICEDGGAAGDTIGDVRFRGDGTNRRMTDLGAKPNDRFCAHWRSGMA